MTWEWVTLISVLILSSLYVFSKAFELYGQKLIEEDANPLIESLSNRVIRLEKEAEETRKFISQSNLTQSLRGVR